MRLIVTVDEEAWREFVASKKNKLARLVKAVCAEFLSLCPQCFPWFIGGLTTEDTEDAEERPPKYDEDSRNRAASSRKTGGLRTG